MKRSLLLCALPVPVSLLTNPEVLNVDHHSMGNHMVTANDKTVVCLRRCPMRDLWEHKDLQPAKSLDLNLPPHGCILYRIRRARARPYETWPRSRVGHGGRRPKRCQSPGTAQPAPDAASGKLSNLRKKL